jgi:hypothetical protein
MVEPFRPCFTAPGFETFVVLVAGLVAAPAGRTVCAMLTGAGMARCGITAGRTGSSPPPGGAPTRWRRWCSASSSAGWFRPGPRWWSRSTTQCSAVRAQSARRALGLRRVTNDPPTAASRPAATPSWSPRSWYTCRSWTGRSRCRCWPGCGAAAGRPSPPPAQRPSAHVTPGAWREVIARTPARLTAITVRAFRHQAPGRIPVRHPAVCSHPPAR